MRLRIISDCPFLLVKLSVSALLVKPVPRRKVNVLPCFGKSALSEDLSLSSGEMWSASIWQEMSSSGSSVGPVCFLCTIPFLFGVIGLNGSSLLAADLKSPRLIELPFDSASATLCLGLSIRSISLSSRCSLTLCCRVAGTAVCIAIVNCDFGLLIFRAGTFCSTGISIERLATDAGLSGGRMGSGDIDFTAGSSSMSKILTFRSNCVPLILLATFWLQLAPSSLTSLTTTVG
mmetsp:Transcript_99405/g.157257  ORF Transcript_99405/g.157257 Transcript_99405/m.157257 type:complete len:233 (-) Transcript_99405:574-1272(-)